MYLQDLSLWDGRELEIHRLLQPSPLALEAVDAAYSDLLELPSKTAVHVRRGDYLSPEGLLRPAPTEYYALAVEQVLARDPSTQFVVFSDDLDWCRQSLGLSDTVYASSNPDWLDLTLMTRCEHHICANSTFSWWGAFLSGDERPIVPWLRGVLPEAFRRAHPDTWHVIEV